MENKMALVLSDLTELRSRRNRRRRPDRRERNSSDPLGTLLENITDASMLYNALKEAEKSKEEEIKKKDKEKSKQKEVDILQLLIFFSLMQFPITLGILGGLAYLFLGKH